MAAGFGKRDLPPDGFDLLPAGAYQMVPKHGFREIVVSSDHRAWRLSPAGARGGSVSFTTPDGRASRIGENIFEIPPQCSILFDIEGLELGPIAYQLECLSSHAPSEYNLILISVLPANKIKLGVHIINSDLRHPNTSENPETFLSPSTIENIVTLVIGVYKRQANIEITKIPVSANVHNFMFEDLGDPIILSTKFKKWRDKKVTPPRAGILELVYSWDFEDFDFVPSADPNNPKDGANGLTFFERGISHVDTRRDSERAIASTTVHELGHALGLPDISSDRNNFMFESGTPYKTKFNAYQIETLNGFNAKFPF